MIQYNALKGLLQLLHDEGCCLDGDRDVNVEIGGDGDRVWVMWNDINYGESQISITIDTLTGSYQVEEREPSDGAQRGDFDVDDDGYWEPEWTMTKRGQLDALGGTSAETDRNCFEEDVRAETIEWIESMRHAYGPRFFEIIERSLSPASAVTHGG